jgi:quercetin dioxygenase-like cupin family protein
MLPMAVRTYLPTSFMRYLTRGCKRNRSMGKTRSRAKRAETLRQMYPWVEKKRARILPVSKISRDAMRLNNRTNNTSSLPPDDLARSSVIARPESNDGLRHVSVVGDTYTILLDGVQTNNQYCLIDMHIPQHGGPPPHRHDFEETFHVLEGEIEATFRGQTNTIKVGETLHIPANAPHRFTNARPEPARLLCICSPAGQEEFFLSIGDLVPTRTSAPPEMDKP